MGDRDYYQNPTDPMSAFFRSSVVKTLIIINIVVFVIQITMTLSENIRWFNTIFGLTPKLITDNLFLWQFFTSMFLHGSFMHLLFNMMGLFFFGPELEWLWGKKTFLKFYLAVGVLSALFQYLLNIHSPIPSIGASGAIYGVLGAYAAHYPDRRIIVLIFPMKMKYFVLLFLIIPAFLGTIGVEGDPGIAHAVHIAGVLLGIAYVKAHWHMLSDFSAWVKEKIRLWKIQRKYKNFKVVDKDVKKMWDDLEERINKKDDKRDYIN